jgi:hypothetical protein
MHKSIINEGLQGNDLKGFVSEHLTIDRYKSKMGDDSDVIVIGFKVKEKFPAIDLMEFIEKGYDFVLDSDISSGEEYDGKYHVFVEVERSKNFPGQLKDLLNGVSKLTDCHDWTFSYQTSTKKVELSKENILEQIPLTVLDYKSYMLERKQNDLKEFFNKGTTEISLDENNNITFKKSFSGDIKAKFISIGDFDIIKDTLPGSLDLSEGSQSQVLFLTKFLGNYDIDKIGNKFLIKNNNQAIVIEKDEW